MNKYGVFDILGPVMIGPSSSHTAGAARLGKIAYHMAGEKIKKVEFQLHGSFAKTYKGHGTDRALVAGILGMDPADENLKNSIEIAKDRNIEIKFTEVDLGDVHPNTVRFIITDINDDIIILVGSSIGGGNVVINEIDGEAVDFTGTYPTLIVKHKDTPGVISSITAILYSEDINIAFMKVYRSSRGAVATMIFETDNAIGDGVLKRINEVPFVSSIKYISL